MYTCGNSDVFKNDENVFLEFPKISKKPLLTEYNHGRSVHLKIKDGS